MSNRKTKFEIELKSLVCPSKLFRSKSKVFVPASIIQKKFRQLKSQEQNSENKKCKYKYLYFDSEDIYIKNILLEDGWILRRNVMDCNLIWVNNINKVPYNPRPLQKYNHFKDSQIITSKQGLNKTLHKNNTIDLNIDNFYPRTYNFQNESLQFKNDYFVTAVLTTLKKLVLLFSRLFMKKSQQKIDFNGYMLGQFNNKFTDPKNQQLLLPKHLLIYQILILQKIVRERQGTLKQEELYLFEVSQEIIEQLLLFSKDISVFPQQMLATPSQSTINILFQYHNYYLKNYPYYESDGVNNIWISKNSAGSKGQGIQLIKNIKDIRGQCGLKLVQKYIQNIYIIEQEQLEGYHKLEGIKRQIKKIVNKKFDIRVWVLVTNVDPMTAYIFNEGVIRISSKQYNLNNIKNLFIHVTNYSVNKQNYQQQDQSYILLSFLLYHLKKQHNHMKLFQDIEDIVIKTLKSGDFKQSKQSFQLFGFDFLLDVNFQPWLLQVNMSPAIKKRGQSKVLLKIRQQMARGMLQILDLIDMNKQYSQSVMFNRQNKWLKIISQKNEFTPNYSQKFQIYGRNVNKNQLNILQNKIIKHQAVCCIQRYIKLKFPPSKQSLQSNSKITSRIKSFIALISKLIKKQKRQVFSKILFQTKNIYLLTEKIKYKRKQSQSDNIRKRTLSKYIITK